MTKEDVLGLSPCKINSEVLQKSKDRWDHILKPLDGLGDFEGVVSKILAINDTSELENIRKALIVMCADHGIVEEGVSQCGQEVTISVATLLGKHKSTASKMAAFAGADCIAIDVGINFLEDIPGVENQKIKPGTNNFVQAPAMSLSEALSAIEVGLNAAKQCKAKGYSLLATGEMGIGNTTSGTAMLCALLGVEVDRVLGRGAGLSDEGLIRKKHVIEAALEKHDLKSPRLTGDYALEVICKVGGLELAAMTGLFIGGALCGLPVIIDGLLSAVSAIAAERLVPGCRDFMIPSHAGKEKGTQLALEALGYTPLINGNMALGEGTGALMAMPLIDMAFDLYRNGLTFDEGSVDQYIRQDKK